MEEADGSRDNSAPQHLGLIGWLGLAWVLFVYCYYYLQWVSCFLGGGYVERYLELILGR